MIHREKRNISGKKFGKLLAIKETSERLTTKTGKKRKGRVYECKCDCGSDCLVYYTDLINSVKKSCGCIKIGGHNKKNLSNKRFGKLLVKKEVPKPKKHEGNVTASFWECICDCGRKTVVVSSSLSPNKTKSCGCQGRLNPKYDIKGKRFGHLTVIERDENTKRGLVKWRCRCICGNEIIVRGTDLRRGRKKSCGCLANLTHKDHHSWKGHEGIYKSHWTKIIRGAEKRGLDFNITIVEVWELFKKQKGKCALSGIDIKLGPPHVKNS